MANLIIHATYELQFTTSLTENWITLAVFYSNVNEGTIPVDSTTGNGFYRLKRIQIMKNNDKQLHGLTKSELVKKLKEVNSPSTTFQIKLLLAEKTPMKMAQQITHNENQNH